MTSKHASDKEEKWISSLRRVIQKAPKNVWLFSAGGCIHVMRKAKAGGRTTLEGGSMDPEYILTTIRGEVDIDGGDW